MLLIKMSTGILPTYEYLELAVDSNDATAAGGAYWKGGSSPTNEIIFSWPKFYWTEKRPKIIGIKLITAQLPYIWDPVNLTNNTFIYTTGGVPTTITVPVGYYTGATLATQLQSLISAVTAGMTVTYSSTTFTFTFTQTISAAPWSLSFPTTATMHAFMGFIVGVPVSATGAGSTITSPIYAQATGPTYLYLNSRTLGPLINFNLADGNASAAGGPQIAKVPVTNVARGNLVLYNDTNDGFYFDFFSSSNLEVFDLYWTLGSDQDESPLDMKGSSWSIKFGILAYREATRDLEQKPNKRGSSMIS
jgi:hypothetical protein